MHWLAQFGYFLVCTITIVLAILGVFAGVTGIAAKAKEGKTKGQLSISKLNKKYKQTSDLLHEKVLSKADLKKLQKADKKQKKSNKKAELKPRLYVLNFHGDIRASDTAALTESINALLLVATDKDQVLVRLESGGGVVYAYGLAASQLQRIKQAGIKLTIAIDKVAASGGYMMACVADHIICAPFAIIGSIGVLMQLPNLHRFLKKKDIDFEQLTAGQFKRTLTVFGENTEKGREKMQHEIDETHELFKSHIQQCRPIVDLEQVATGEHWYGQQAIDFKLVDQLQTSDDFLLNSRHDFHLYEISYKMKQPLVKKLLSASESLLSGAH
ncbi:MAG: protease SohB [Coxiellaceae bacterium]|nr:protease SohB [Coxiellaceae bacterium]